MFAFYIWSPHLDEHQRLRFILTNGGVVDGIIRSREFVESLVRQLGVTVKIREWTITPYRSNYFTEYLGEADWRDIWQLVWLFEVELEGAAVPQAGWEERGIGTNATGPDWSEGPSDDSAVNCLVISDFLTVESLEAAVAAMQSEELAKLRSQYGVDRPRITRSHVAAQGWQLQADLGQFSAKFFAEGADYAERALDLCRKAGGTVHCDD